MQTLKNRKKRKRIIENLNEAKKRKAAVEKCIQKLFNDADQKREDAEKKNKMSLVVESNAFRAKAKEKQKEVKTWEGKIEALKSQLTNEDNI